MSNLRNEFEFRSGLLDALGVEHTEADAKNEERWRSKMLDGLGVEYNQNDVNQFGLFRAKLLEGVENYSGGGSGGGGESDFSIAEVVLTNNSGNPFMAYGATFYNEEYKYSTATIYESESRTIPIILYKGKAYIDLQSSLNKSAVVLSGDITGVNDGFQTTRYKGFDITGDCTITIS